MSKYMIRAAQTGDCIQISELCAQLGYPTTPEQIKQRLNHLLNYADQTIFVLSRGQENTIYGWVHILIVQYLESEKFAEIGGLVVDQNHRRSGFGKKLMQAAEEWAIQQDIFTVRLRSNAIRIEAHKFYENLGYQNQKTQYTFVKHLK